MTADSVGGVWQYSDELSRALASDHEVIVAHLGPASDPARSPATPKLRVVETGLPLDWLAATRAEVEASAEAVAALADELSVDLVQLNSPALAVADFDCPVIAVDHGCVATWWAAVNPEQPLPEEFAWHAAMVGEGLRAADLVVAPSAAYGREVRACYRLPFAPITVHNGRAPLAVAEDAPSGRAFTAGRLWDAAKATPLMDAIAARLPLTVEAAGPLQGPNGERVEIRHLAHLGVLDQARLAAKLAERPLFVSTARFEPFGLAVLEAAASGCPLVLSETPTFRELWNGAALFVRGEDPDRWADAIAGLVADPARLTTLGAAAAKRALRYTPAAMADGMRAAYDRLVPRRQAA